MIIIYAQWLQVNNHYDALPVSAAMDKMAVLMDKLIVAKNQPNGLQKLRIRFNSLRELALFIYGKSFYALT